MRGSWEDKDADQGKAQQYFVVQEKESGGESGAVTESCPFGTMRSHKTTGHHCPNGHLCASQTCPLHPTLYIPALSTVFSSQVSEFR